MTPTPSGTAIAVPSAMASPSPTLTATPSPSAEPPTATPLASLEAIVTPGSPAGPTPFVYTVKSGDNLYNIALQFNTTVQAIMEANGLADDRLRVGQKLIIPSGTATPTATPQ